MGQAPTFLAALEQAKKVALCRRYDPQPLGDGVASLTSPSWISPTDRRKVAGLPGQIPTGSSRKTTHSARCSVLSSAARDQPCRAEQRRIAGPRTDPQVPAPPLFCRNQEAWRAPCSYADPCERMRVGGREPTGR